MINLKMTFVYFRLYSDYLYFRKDKTTSAAELFHEKVNKSIEILNRCFVSMSERACIYNPANIHLPVSAKTILDISRINVII